MRAAIKPLPVHPDDPAPYSESVEHRLCIEPPEKARHRRRILQGKDAGTPVEANRLALEKNRDYAGSIEALKKLRDLEINEQALAILDDFIYKLEKKIEVESSQERAR